MENEQRARGVGSTAPHWPYYLVSGHAKLPQDAAARTSYEFLAIVVAVEPETGVILEVDSNLLTTVAKDYLARLLLGVSLNDPVGPILDNVQRYYWGGAKKTVAAAARDLYDTWSKLIQTLESAVE